MNSYNFIEKGHFFFDSFYDVHEYKTYEMRKRGDYLCVERDSMGFEIFAYKHKATV